MKLNSQIKSWINKHSHAVGIAYGLHLRRALNLKAQELIKTGVSPQDALLMIQGETPAELSGQPRI